MRPPDSDHKRMKHSMSMLHADDRLDWIKRKHESYKRKIASTLFNIQATNKTNTGNDYFQSLNME